MGLPLVVVVNAPLRDEARRYRTLPHPELAAEIEKRVFDSALRIFAQAGAPRIRWSLPCGTSDCGFS